MSKEYEIPGHMVKVHRFCDCGGEFLPCTGFGGAAGLSGAYGTQWYHKCNQCGLEDSFPIQYPQVRFKEGKK